MIFLLWKIIEITSKLIFVFFKNFKDAVSNKILFKLELTLLRNKINFKKRILLFLFVKCCNLKLKEGEFLNLID